jgi:putative pyridoxal-dependent aspartate 1-decarboxylase
MCILSHSMPNTRRHSPRNGGFIQPGAFLQTVIEDHTSPASGYPRGTGTGSQYSGLRPGVAARSHAAKPKLVMKAKLVRLFSASSRGAARQTVRLRKRVGSFLAGAQVTSAVGSERLAGQFANSLGPDDAVPVDLYFNYLERTIVPHSINMFSPRCMGHMSNVLPRFAVALTELVVAINQNLAKREASKTLTLLERQTAGMLHRLVFARADVFYRTHIQRDGSTLGIMTSGGTVANITALWIARNRCLGPRNGFRGVEKEGLAAALAHYGYRDAVILGSSLMHYSLAKAATLLGLGERSVVRIPVDAQHRVDLGALSRAVEGCVAQRRRVIAIVGIAGTTDSGSIDPLLPIAQLARRAGVHFHVDAAWGAPLLFSAQYRHKLMGIARADSVTVDGHKQLYMPLGTSMLLLRNPAAARLIEKQAHYMLERGSGDLGKYSLEGSRPGNAVFMHAGLHIIGERGYECLIDENIRKAKHMAALIRAHPAFELLLEPQSNIVLYRYVPRRWRCRRTRREFPSRAASEISQLNQRIQQAQYRAGRTFVSRTTIGSRRRLVALRAVIANPLTTERDIEAVLNDQLHLARQLEQPR